MLNLGVLRGMYRKGHHQTCEHEPTAERGGVGWELHPPPSPPPDVKKICWLVS
jgi:hypothetical protein